MTIEEQMKPIPEGKISSIHIEGGEWDGREYDLDFDADLFLDPDGVTVWAKVCSLDGLPVKSKE